MTLYVARIDGTLFLFWDALDALTAIWNLGAHRCTLRAIPLRALAGIAK